MILLRLFGKEYKIPGKVENDVRVTQNIITSFQKYILSYRMEYLTLTKVI